MAPRPILRGADFVLSAERGPEAPAALYSTVCLACGAQSGTVADEDKPVAVWALEHTRQYGPDHWRFLFITQSYCQVVPVRSALASVSAGRVHP